jgi:predicted kinase
MQSSNWEADMFWPKGVFIGRLISTAHQWCQANVQRDMLHDVPNIIVSNTSIRTKDFQIYIDMAERMRYTYTVIRTPYPWDSDELAERNIHDVPSKTIQRWIETYEPFDGELMWEDLTIFEN